MARLVVMDIETYDPNLSTLGDGACRNDGRILCCGAYGDGIDEVFDFDKAEDIARCRELVEDPDIDLVFHNGLYDLSWMHCAAAYGFQPRGRLHDTMTRAALINEYVSLSLDECCKRMHVQGKNKDETIEKWYASWQDKMKGVAKTMTKKRPVPKQNDEGKYLNKDTGEWVELTPNELDIIVHKKYKGKLWDNAMVVWNDPEGRRMMKMYNRQDCIATYNLFHAQEKYMGHLQSVYDLECKVLPILLRMKKLGIRVDLEHMQRLKDRVEEAYNKSEQNLIRVYGIDGPTIKSSAKLGARLNEMGIYSPVQTATGTQSWASDALTRIHHPVIPLIQEFKNYDSILNKYLHGALSEAVVDGRIHCTFVPMLRDSGDGGTVTGRFSCKDPNLQQIPARDKGHGTDFSQDMRAIFLPEEGHMLAAMDYSQIEALLLGHFARGPQADWFRQQLNAGVDMHKIAMQLTGIKYRPAVKTFNYGCIYGMGWQTALDHNYTLFEKLAAEEGVDVETFTHEIYDTYHAKFPVVKDTMEWCQQLALVQGYIDTLGGRRLHKPIPKYDPKTHKIQNFIYKMLNKLIQGTAADIFKQALVTADEAGIYSVLLLHLLVHDEQVNSVPFNKEGTEAAVELQRIMGDVYHDRLLVPLKAECELGPNWGYWSGDIYEEMKKGNFDPAFFKKDYRETH